VKVDETRGFEMKRTDDDSWDLASSVGATATMVAAARAAATIRPDPVVIDPFAEPLVRAVGLNVFNRMASTGEAFANLAEGVALPRMVDTFAARARYFDKYFADATAAGLRQVVIVASGLDARAYRLSWPAGTTVYEIDQPEVIEFKTSTLSKIGAAPATEHRAVGIDLREDWPAALRETGFDATQPTAWLAEGLLIGFLPVEAEVRLLDDVISLSANGSWLAADYGTIVESSEQAREKARLMTDGWRQRGFNLDVAGLTYAGDHTDVAAYLAAGGWETASAKLNDLVVAAGLPELSESDAQAPGATISFVRAIRTCFGVTPDLPDRRC
jgi:methyltransferase (TIGR00027 family)